MPVLTHPPVISLSPSLQSPSRLLQRSSGSLHNSLYFTVLTHPPVISLPSSLHCSSVSLHSNVAPSVPPLPILPPPPVILSLDHSSTRRYRFTRLSLYPIIACPYPSTRHLATSIPPQPVFTPPPVIPLRRSTLCPSTVIELPPSLHCLYLPLFRSYRSLNDSTAPPYALIGCLAPFIPPTLVNAFFLGRHAPSISPMLVCILALVISLPPSPDYPSLPLHQTSRSINHFNARPHPSSTHLVLSFFARSVPNSPPVLCLPPSLTLLHSPYPATGHIAPFITALLVRINSQLLRSLRPSTVCTYLCTGYFIPFITILSVLTHP